MREWRAAETQSLGKELYLGKLYLAVREWKEERFSTNTVKPRRCFVLDD